MILQNGKMCVTVHYVIMKKIAFLMFVMERDCANMKLNVSMFSV